MRWLFWGGVTSTPVAHADGWGDIAGAIYGSVILPQLIQIGAGDDEDETAEEDTTDVGVTDGVVDSEHNYWPNVTLPQRYLDYRAQIAAITDHPFAHFADNQDINQYFIEYKYRYDEYSYLYGNPKRTYASPYQDGVWLWDGNSSGKTDDWGEDCGQIYANWPIVADGGDEFPFYGIGGFAHNEMEIVLINKNTDDYLCLYYVLDFGNQWHRDTDEVTLVEPTDQERLSWWQNPKYTFDWKCIAQEYTGNPEDIALLKEYSEGRVFDDNPVARFMCQFLANYYYPTQVDRGSGIDGAKIIPLHDDIPDNPYR